MIRVLLYFIAVVLIGTGFASLANYPGELVIMVSGQRVVVSVFVAVCALLFLVLAILVLWWLIKTLILSPKILKNHFLGRRRDRGYYALTHGLIAVLSGDAASARRMARQGSKLLKADHEPLLQFLEAKARLLDYDQAGAIALYETMRNDPQTRLLGLRGLYDEAMQNGAIEAAGQYAAEAAKLNPSLKWASSAVLERLGSAGAWSNAIALFDNYEKAQPRKIAKSENLTHRRVVLMTAQARDLFETYPDEARRIALKALKLEPAFIPAVNIAARILFRLDEVRKGSKLIESAWKNTPHPDLALTYVNAKAGESALERLKRARQLSRFNPQNRESFMIVAQTAFEAGEYVLARKNAERVLPDSATESTFLLLADIEAAQSGNQGKIRQWLSRAVRAPADPVWIADGVMLPEWAAVSPVTGRLDACIWAQPAKSFHKLSVDGEALIPLQELDAVVGPNTSEISDVALPSHVEIANVKDSAPLSKTDTVAKPEPEAKPTVDAPGLDKKQPYNSAEVSTEAEGKPGKVKVEKTLEHLPLAEPSRADKKSAEKRSKKPVMVNEADIVPVIDVEPVENREPKKPMTRIIVDDPGVDDK